MKFKKAKEPIYSSDPYYDLFDGGAIKPEKLLVDKAEAKLVRESIKKVRAFLDEAVEVGAIEFV